MGIVDLLLLLPQDSIIGRVDLSHLGLGLLDLGALRLHLSLERVYFTSQLLTLGIAKSRPLCGHLGYRRRGCIRAGLISRKRGLGVVRAGISGIHHAQILVDATRHMRQMPVDKRPLLIGHALHEITVMRDENQRTRPTVKQVLHDGEHVGIEVVAGLVENQNVGLIENREQQRQATALTAR